MYDWRKMTPEQREEALTKRLIRHYPWHSPPHQEKNFNNYLISAACFEHKPHIGKSAQRMADFESQLLAVFDKHTSKIHAWCVLPNHYHVLAEITSEITSLDDLTDEIGEMHGRISYEWNQEDQLTGRQVWHRCSDRGMRSQRHFLSSLNYVHNNPVRHGYVTHWQDWPFSSAKKYLESVGRKEAERVWREYPLLKYGDKWDLPEW